MKPHNKNTLRILSIVLILTMLFGTVSSFAYSMGSMTSGGPAGSAGSGGSGKNWWNGGAQFIRVSLYWAPGAGTKDKEGADWSNWDNIIRVGKSFDMWVGKTKPLEPVGAHSNFATALDYAKNGNKFLMEYRGDYFDTGAWRTLEVPNYQFADGETVEEYEASKASGDYMAHPTPMSPEDIGTDVKEFFYKKYALDNNTIWQAGAGATGQHLGIDAENHLRRGIYKDAYGKERQGTYLILIEPGAYAMVNGVYSAYTGRDAINHDDVGGSDFEYTTRYGGVYLTLSRIAHAAYLEDGMNYTGLNLVSQGTPPDRDSIDNKSIRNYYDQFRSSWGIGAIMYWDELPSLPVIKYYYNLTQADLDRAAKSGTSSGSYGQIAGEVPQFSYTEENGIPMLVESEYGYDENYRQVLRPKQGGAKYTLAEAIKKYPQLVNDKADNAEAIANTSEKYTAEAKETFKEQEYFLAGHYFNQRFPLVSNYGSGLTSVALRIFKVCSCKLQGQAFGAKAPLQFT